MSSYDNLTDEEYLNHPKITSLNKTQRIMTNIVKNIRAQQEAEKKRQEIEERKKQYEAKYGMYDIALNNPFTRTTVMAAKGINDAVIDTANMLPGVNLNRHDDVAPQNKYEEFVKDAFRLGYEGAAEVIALQGLGGAGGLGAGKSLISKAAHSLAKTPMKEVAGSAGTISAARNLVEPENPYTAVATDFLGAAMYPSVANLGVAGKNLYMHARSNLADRVNVMKYRSQIDEMAKNMTVKDPYVKKIELGPLSKKHVDELNRIRTENHVYEPSGNNPVPPEYQYNDNFSVHDWGLKHMRERRIENNGYSPKSVATNVVKTVYNPYSVVSQSEKAIGDPQHFGHIQTMIHPNNQTSGKVFLSTHSGAGYPILKSFHKRQSDRTLKDFPLYKNALENHKIPGPYEYKTKKYMPASTIGFATARIDSSTDD